MKHLKKFNLTRASLSILFFIAGVIGWMLCKIAIHNYKMVYFRKKCKYCDREKIKMIRIDGKTNWQDI